MTTAEPDLKSLLQAGTDVSWWGTPAGIRFADWFRTNLAGAVVSQLRTKVGEDVEADDVVAFLIDTLATTPPQTRSLIAGVAGAQSPAGYLVSSLVRNLSWGRTVAGIPERLETITEEHPVRLAGTAIPLMVPDIPGLVWWHFTQPRPGTDLADAISLTVEALEVYAHGAVSRLVLHAAVCYLAMNPEQHKGYGHTEMRNNTDLLTLGLTHRQIEALVNVCWGARGPRQRETSLLYQALKHSDAPLREAQIAQGLADWHSAAELDMDPVEEVAA
ncbi:MAG: hypothetical protein ABF811_07795 [Pseudoclavibacter sp.]